ncbi:MAG: hypothetical protein MUF87_22550 [Anaerolineae bacterium]|nr:hypothetical protein [Anaerolineae bacterium]
MRMMLRVILLGVLLTLSAGLWAQEPTAEPAITSEAVDIPESGVTAVPSEIATIAAEQVATRAAEGEGGGEAAVDVVPETTESEAEPEPGISEQGLSVLILVIGVTAVFLAGWTLANRQNEDI